MLQPSKGKTLRKWGASFVTGSLFLVFWLIPGHGNAESLGVLANRADTIVVAVPLHKTCYWDKKIIKTRALLKVVKVIAGKISKREISVIYDGGVVGKIGLKVTRGVRLPLGQKDVLFLIGQGPPYTILNGMGGIFFVSPSPTGEVVIPAEEVFCIPGLTVKSLKNGVTSSGSLGLKEFIDKIHSLRGDQP